MFQVTRLTHGKTPRLKNVFLTFWGKGAPLELVSMIPIAQTVFMEKLFSYRPTQNFLKKLPETRIFFLGLNNQSLVDERGPQGSGLKPRRWKSESNGRNSLSILLSNQVQLLTTYPFNSLLPSVTQFFNKYENKMLP